MNSLCLRSRKGNGRRVTIDRRSERLCRALTALQPVWTRGKNPVEVQALGLKSDLGLYNTIIIFITNIGIF